MEQNQSEPKRSLDYSNWTQHYAMLSESYREDPMKAIMNLTTIDCLYDVRQELWQMMIDVMASENTETDDPSTVGERIFFFQNLHEIFELAYRIRELVIDKKLVYQYLFH
jgi:hypothetical protein